MFLYCKRILAKWIINRFIEGVVAFCKKKKINILKGYPAVPYSKDIPALFAWTGIPASFERAGFKEVARRSYSRPIMRYNI